MDVLKRLESKCSERGTSVRLWSESRSLAFGTAGERCVFDLGVTVEVGRVSGMVMKVDGTEDIGTWRQRSLMPSLGTLRSPPNGARIWEGEGDRETVG